jgi:Rieske Fe-S protein
MNKNPTDPSARFPDGRADSEQPAWRQDFPIDWPEDHYVARRDYAKFLVLTSLAFAVGQLCIGFQSLARRALGRPRLLRVGELREIPVGGALTFNYPGRHDPCLLIRLNEETLAAYGQKCTHLSCAVTPRLAQGELHCPCHVGSFDLATGRPIAGPPRRPLPKVILEVRNGFVYATGVEERTI